jgi:dihydroflavonol-4-reductase
MLDGSTPGTPKLHMGFVDVRDVAAMHVAAMTAEGASGERFILSESSMWLSEMATVLREAGFNQAPKRNIPNFLLKVIAMFDKDLAGTIPLLGRVGTYDISKTKDILGWQPTKAADAIIDTAKHFKEKGII